jgi:hypothetical protein
MGQTSAGPAMVINEIYYEPVTAADHTEFIELYNAGANPIGLDGWCLDEDLSYCFAQGVVVQPGGYLVVAADPAALQRKTGLACQGPFAGRLDGRGARIVLRDASGRTVDQVDYKLGFPWPTGGPGRSIELINASLDNGLGGSWRASVASGGTPGAANSVRLSNAPPQIRQVGHSPQEPTSGRSVVVTAKVTDPQGVGSVTLAYQVVQPGHYIPAWLPVPLTTLEQDAATAMQKNPDLDAPGRWTVLRMVDDGTDADATASDGVFTAVIPGQPHRTLVRYRITAADLASPSVSITVPYEDDGALNFAFWVYDGVPAYVANTHSVVGSPHAYSPEVLETLPVYHLITRAEDLAQCYGYRESDRIPADRVAAGQAFNWEGALVFDGQVYDHVLFRLDGGEGRYALSGKRSMRVHFNRGHAFQARDRYGRPTSQGWQDLQVSRMFDGRTAEETNALLQQGNFGLVETVNSILWQLVGVPCRDTHWFHFRVVDGEQEAPDQYHGDFWGLFLAVEPYDSRFLSARNLADGNLYTLPAGAGKTDQMERFQGRSAVTDSSDLANLRSQVVPGKTEAELRRWVDYDAFFRYLAVAEAVRHYDVAASGQDENVAFYFSLDSTGASAYGSAWYLPYDTTATWGPTASAGLTMAWKALEPAGSDGQPHTSNPGGLTALKTQFRSEVRELRDLLWNPETIDPLLDDLASLIGVFALADQDRWTGVPEWAYDAGQHNTFTASMEDKLSDMKRFAWVGNQTWPSPDATGAVAPGGQTAVLDQIAGQEGDAGAIPNTPTVTYTGPAGYPLDSLTFKASAFSSPQAAGTFGVMAWRIAEFSDVNSPQYDPSTRKYEMQAVWQSPEITPYRSDVTIPAGAGLQVGHVYRVRSRMKDNTGRWSHWSAPVQFTAGTPLDTRQIDSLRITEILASPAEPPTSHPNAEFVEIKNIGASPIDLSGVRFTEGIGFTFGAMTLNPAQYAVVVKSRTAFESIYGKDLPVAGQFTGRLDNAGESITLADSRGLTIMRFSYDPTWYPETQGPGYSLVATSAAMAGTVDWSTSAAWRASTLLGGSPGKGDPADVPAAGSIVINEVLAHSHEAAPDWIELYNTTSLPISIGGWFLSSSQKDPTRYQILSGTVVPAKGYAVFYENSSFGNPSAPGCRSAFALSEAGDAVVLTSGYAGQPTGYTERVSFGASERGVSFGRYVRSDGEVQFVSMSEATPGAANAYPKVGPVVINEVMYNPAGSSDAEYVELLNISSDPVTLYDAAAKLAWWFTDDPNKPGIQFSFSGVSDVTMAPGQYILLVRKLSVFKALYSVPAGIPVFEWASGKLDNSGAKLDLTKAFDTDGLGTIGWVRVDRVVYSDGSHPSGSDPWPKDADGAGYSLSRIRSDRYGNDPTNWKAALPSPGKANP